MAWSDLAELSVQVLQSSSRGSEPVAQGLFPELPHGGDKAPSSASQRWDWPWLELWVLLSQPGTGGCVMGV